MEIVSCIVYKQCERISFDICQDWAIKILLDNDINCVLHNLRNIDDDVDGLKEFIESTKNSDDLFIVTSELRTVLYSNKDYYKEYNHKGYTFASLLTDYGFDKVSDNFFPECFTFYIYTGNKIGKRVHTLFTKILCRRGLNYE